MEKKLSLKVIHMKFQNLEIHLNVWQNLKIVKMRLLNIRNFSIYGTQFHPEMTKDGQTMITKFSKL